MRRVTAVPPGPWVTTVSTGSLVIWRETAVCACATAVPDTSAKPAAKVPMSLIAKPPSAVSARAQRGAGGAVPGRGVTFSRQRPAESVARVAFLCSACVDAPRPLLLRAHARAAEPCQRPVGGGGTGGERRLHEITAS